MMKLKKTVERLAGDPSPIENRSLQAVAFG
jgi:hypothetical protein